VWLRRNREAASPVCLNGRAAGDFDFVVDGCLPLFDDATPAVIFDDGVEEGRVGEDVMWFWDILRLQMLDLEAYQL
jgi:hypothetical protein